MTSTGQDNLRETYDEEGDLNYDFGTNRHLVKSSSVARYMDGDKIEAMISHYTNSDKSSDKTFTRQFVEKYLQKVSFK
jgi:exoribonuclease II